MAAVSDHEAGRYKIGTVTRLLGFSPMALRNWERRYSFLEPERGPGGQRLYTDSDLRVLQAIRQLLDRGHPIGEIALKGRAALLKGISFASVPEPARETEETVATEVAEEASHLSICLADVEKAAVELDSPRLQRALDLAFSLFAPHEVLRQVIVPAARRLGELWVRGECGIASEHLASAAFKSRIQRLVESAAASAADEGPLAITTCFPEEQHELGALLVAFDLSRRGIRVVHLGPSLPLEDLELAMKRLRPCWVFLSVTRTATYEAHKPRLLDMLERMADRTRFAVGGPAVHFEDEDLIRCGATVCDASRPVEEAISQLVDDDQEGT
jgi:DNA-binding transcriptional MerR regulator